MSEELLQNVIDILDNAHSQRLQLTELLQSLQESKNQVKQSAEESRNNIREHFTKLKKTVNAALDARCDILMKNVDSIEDDALSPLCQCEEMINQGLTTATRVMEDGKNILDKDPKDNVQLLVNFKDNPDTKNLDSVPEVPHLSDVPYISVELPQGLPERLSQLISMEGRITERPPVQITEIIEGPGSLLIKWVEVDDEIEVSDFQLQYCCGGVKSNQDSSVIFHNAYLGPATTHRVKHLRTQTPYSFRVCCRSDSCSEWSQWSIPRFAMTTIPHYQWSADVQGYTTSNDDKTSTRLDTEDSFIHYSKDPSYCTGYPITFKVLDIGEGSPMDGIGFAIDKSDTFTLQRKDAVFITTSGTIFVDGNEMKMKLPPFTRGSAVTFESEVLSNGKVRVSAEVKEKEVTFDWTIESPLSTFASAFGIIASSTTDRNFYFGARFSHEDWKISVE